MAEDDRPIHNSSSNSSSNSNHNSAAAAHTAVPVTLSSSPPSSSPNAAAASRARPSVAAAAAVSPVFACSVCDIVVHSALDLRTHQSGKNHSVAEAAFIRGMQAALRYLDVCLAAMPPLPASTPSADALAAERAAAAAFNASLPDLAESADARALFLSAATPHFRALTDSLREHERGRTWCAFLDAVACGVGLSPMDRSDAAHWRRAFQSELDHADYEVDPDEDAADDYDYGDYVDGDEEDCDEVDF